MHWAQNNENKLNPCFLLNFTEMHVVSLCDTSRARISVREVETFSPGSARTNMMTLHSFFFIFPSSPEATHKHHDTTFRFFHGFPGFSWTTKLDFA